MCILRFHVVFENLIDVGFEAPSAKLTTVYNIWLVLDGLARYFTLSNIFVAFQVLLNLTKDASIHRVDHHSTILLVTIL